MKDDTPVEFQHFLSERDAFLVVSLIGAMNADSSAKLDQLSTQITDRTAAKFVILNFRDVTEISQSIVPALAQVQRNVRAKSVQIRLCGLRPTLKDRLLLRGVIRRAEMVDNLPEAIKSFRDISKKPAE